MSHDNSGKYNMTLIQQAYKDKLVLKPQAHSFNTTNTSYVLLIGNSPDLVFLFGELKPKV